MTKATSADWTTLASSIGCPSLSKIRKALCCWALVPSTADGMAPSPSYRRGCRIALGSRSP